MPCSNRFGDDAARALELACNRGTDNRPAPILKMKKKKNNKLRNRPKQSRATFGDGRWQMATLARHNVFLIKKAKDANIQ